MPRQSNESLGEETSEEKRSADAFNNLASEIADVRDHLRDDLRGLQDAIDDLRTEIQWAARQIVPGFQFKSMATDPTDRRWAQKLNDRPESIACMECDLDSPGSLATALQAGWINLQPDDGPGWNYLGLCPDCRKHQDEATLESKSKTQGSETVACMECTRASPSTLAEAITQGWTDIAADTGPTWNFTGLCPNCRAEITANVQQGEPAEDASSTDAEPEGQYCCSSPKLTWNGDPDTPGVACEHCGFMVAEDGAVTYGEKPFGDPQKKLF
jgi:hypothetical protein